MSASEFSALRDVHRGYQNQFSGTRTNGCCSRCIQLGIPYISSHWTVVDEGERIRPRPEANMKEDIAIIAKRFLRDTDYPLVNLCWCCKSAKTWMNGLGWSRADSKQAILKFGMVRPSDITNLDEDHDQSRAISMAELPTQTLSVARQVAPRPDYKRIRGWLNTCCVSHTQCTPNEPDTLEAVRVIDVRHKSIVHLPKGTPYLALSYVWGRANQPNLPLATQFLPFALPAKVPRTIEHAMRVTRRLRFKYLWVDSVCIDQSNYADKTIQMGMMDRIYQGAHATIVALDSPSANSGLCRVGRKSAQISPVRGYHRGVLRYLSFPPTLREELDRSIWMKRGWTYQEGLLSNRCLFFSRNQVYFTCNEAGHSEDLDDRPAISRRRRKSERDDTSHHQAFINPLRLPGAKHLRPATIFNSMLREYTNRKLTNEEDALNAVSGALRLLQAGILPKGFLFGLPLDLFRSALLWTHSTCNPLVPRDTKSFPSWSWASWHLRSPIRLEDDVDECWNDIQPPLEIRYMDSWIEARERQCGSPRLQGLQMLYDATTRQGSDISAVPPPSCQENHLYVRGILLTLPYSSTSAHTEPHMSRPHPSSRFALALPHHTTREQTVRISLEVSRSTSIRIHFLLISVVPISIYGDGARLISLKLLMLAGADDVARRVGVATVMMSEDELVRIWEDDGTEWWEGWVG
jgi:hypothetical protein